MAEFLSNITEAFSNMTSLFSNGSDVISQNVTSAVPARGRGPRFFPWANPNNVITQKMADDITSTLQCYIFPILTVFGLAGNVCSLIVLTQKRLRVSPTSAILAGLAVSDFMFLITNGIRKSTGIIELYDKKAAATLTAVTFKYIFYLKTCFSRVSTLLVVLISVERFIAVAFPLKAKMLITRRRMVFAVIVCYVITFVGLAAYPPQYTYAYYGDTPRIAYTDFARDHAVGLKFYNEYFLPIVYRHIPVVIVFILNAAIIVLLKRSKRFQKSTASQDSKRRDDQKKITRMLLTVAIVYLICLLPGDVFLRCSVTVDGFVYFGTYHNLFMALSDISLLFEMANSCINFVIYMVLNKNFYETYVRLFCCRCLMNSDQSTSPGLTKSTSMKTADTVLADGKKEVTGSLFNTEQDDKSKIHDAAHKVNETEGHVNGAYIE